MILNVNQKEYLPKLLDTAGIRLVVHEPGRIPFPEDEGITASPGYSTSVGIRKVKFPAKLMILIKHFSV